MIRLLKQLRPDELGATAVEYGLIISLIVLAMISALGGVADVTVNMWGNVSSQVRNST
jgi:pilus assembly protein Flp/PilA